jgi:shikimate kinase
LHRPAKVLAYSYAPMTSPFQIGPILLVGFMGAGKSSVGAALASELGCSFIDLDAVVEENAGQPAAAIFGTEGEQRFRQIESEALDQVLSTGTERRVIALGGGTYAQSGNRDRIARSGALVVFLEVELEEAMRRVGDFVGTRPLAANREAFARLFEERRSAYGQAHVRTDTTNKPITTIAKELAAWFREQERQS